MQRLGNISRWPHPASLLSDRFFTKSKAQESYCLAVFKVDFFSIYLFILQAKHFILKENSLFFCLFIYFFESAAINTSLTQSCKISVRMTFLFSFDLRFVSIYPVLLYMSISHTMWLNMYTLLLCVYSSTSPSPPSLHRFTSFIISSVSSAYRAVGSISNIQ